MARRAQLGRLLASSRLRVRRYLRRFGTKSSVGADARAGLVLGVESVPDGLAAGLLAGVSPLFGLYGYLVGTIGGALSTGSVFMSVQVTGAMAVVISDVPAAHGKHAGAALGTLAVLTGLMMLTLGVARLGSLVRFIPTSVLVGFVNAVAVNIVLGQLDNLTGYDADGDNRIIRAADTLLHPAGLDWTSVLIGGVTAALILGLERTLLGALSMVLAIVAGSAIAVLAGLDSVARLSDITEVPDSLPLPALPDLSLIISLIIPALSLTLVGLVQGAAISAGIPNPDGRYPNASADFSGQGVANIAAGTFGGMPVGGSMSATSLVRAAGARSALGNLVAGVVIGGCVLTLAPLIGYIAMPALAALLILVGIRTFKPHDVAMVLRTGPIQATVMTVTFVLTLIIPLQYATLIGVGLAIVLHVVRQSNKVVVRRWVFDDEHPFPVETDPPRFLEAGDIVVLSPYGSLFFAATPVVAKQLPQPTGNSKGTVVIIRLRGKDDLGATFITALVRYAGQLHEAGATLMLAGLGQRAYQQLVATHALATIGTEHVFTASPRIGDSIGAALDAARAWSTRPAP